MSFQPYPLLPSAAFGGATVAIEGAAQGALFDLLDAAAPGPEGPGGPSQAAVTLVPDPASGGLKVFHGRSKLGQLPASPGSITAAGAPYTVTASVKRACRPSMTTARCSGQTQARLPA